MKKNIFLEALSQRTLIIDGAMGTMLYKKGVFINSCFDLLCLNNISLLESVHREYYLAGADIVETNTFGANEVKLARFGLSEKTEEINVTAVEIAKKAVNEKCFVAGAMGPLGVDVTPQNSQILKKTEEVFKRQAKSLSKGGADLIILETFLNPYELMIAISAVSQVTDLPIISQLTVPATDETFYGDNILQTIQKIQSIDRVSAIGFNCSLGPSQMLTLLEKIKNVVNKPISLQPNAGLPKEVDGRSIYMCTPEYMAEYAKKFFEKGVRIIGGCCGTGPEHISEIAKAVKGLDRAFAKKKIQFSAETKKNTKIKTTEPIKLEKKSKISAKLAKGVKVFSIELSPPKGVNIQGLLENVKLCAQLGIDAINIPDGPRASSRLSAFATGIRIQQVADIEAIVHFCCRDKNLIAMQSDILGAYAVGIKNVLMITGDPPKVGEYPGATGVYDLDSVALTKVVHDLNRGIDIAGNRFDPAIGLVGGVGVNPVSVDIERELERFAMKVEAGAEFAITQPVFDVDIFFDFMKKIEKYKIPIIAGIWPLTSYKNAEFMANEVPGVSVPENILMRMKKCQSRETSIREGISIAKEMISQIEGIVSGFAVSAPFGNAKIALASLKKLEIQKVFA